MPFTVTIDRSPQFVRFRVAGPASRESYFDLIEQAARETQAAGDTLGMADLRGIVGRLKFTDQYFIGELVGARLKHLRKLATLVSSDPTTYNSETVANRTGVNSRTFDDEAKALAWLTEPDSDDRGSAAA